MDQAGVAGGRWQQFCFAALLPARIPSGLMHMNHDPKWDERLNSHYFSCLLIGLLLRSIPFSFFCPDSFGYRGSYFKYIRVKIPRIFFSCGILTVFAPFWVSSAVWSARWSLSCRTSHCSQPCGEDAQMKIRCGQ